MKRRFNLSKGQTQYIGWAQYIAMVLAFIGLWQMLSGGATVLHRLL